LPTTGGSVRPILTVNRVNMSDLPVPLPRALASSLFFSIGPEGSDFPQGFTVTLPNTDSVNPNGHTPIFHYLPERPGWEVASNATASSDGATLSLTIDAIGGVYAALAPKAVHVGLNVILVDENGPVDFSGTAQNSVH